MKIHRGVGVPITIAEKAVQFAQAEGVSKNRRRRKNSFEERDEVWAIFDRDEHDRFDEAVDLCRLNGIGVARSNPCFEVWLILHEADYDRPDDRRDAQRELQRLRPEYDRDREKVPNCRELVLHVMEAEARGDVLLQRRVEEGNPYGRPSTMVGALTKAIRKASELARNAASS